MITLARHIELLLLEHDCVIVPGLGGFITNHADARYTGGDEHLFLPPYRTVGFNPQLQMNDGLLVQSYMAAYDASYPAAHLQMEKDVERLVDELEQRGEYTLDAVGTLRKELNGNLTFATPEPGVLTPSLYGLYSYEISSLTDVTRTREAEELLQAATMPQPVTDGQTHPGETGSIIIRIGRHWLDFGISAAAAVLLFFGISYPALNSAGSGPDTVVAAFYQPTRPAPAQAKAGKPQPPTTVVATALPGTESEQPAADTTQPEEKQQVQEQYAIVLASYVSQANAEEYIRQLTKSGFAEGRYAKTGKVSRVLYASYASEAKAQEALQTLRQQSGEFAEAWVLAVQP